MKRSIKFLTALILVIPILGFAMPSQPAPNETGEPDYEKGKVFGRVVMIENGKAVEFGSSPFSRHLTIFVKRNNSDQIIPEEISGDGKFLWRLEPDNYVIVGFNRVDLDGERISSRIWATFSLISSTNDLYVGDLTIESNHNQLRFNVVDNFDSTIQRDKSASEPTKGLMEFESPLGSYKKIVPICSNLWELHCGRDFYGVEPISPKPNSVVMFPTVESLNPKFEWVPSNKKDVTYDIAIYEVLSFTYGLTGSVSRLRGELIEYQESLNEPRYVISRTLKPGKKYEWSVRMRDGETVSTWSTENTALFALVAFRRTSGHGFGFASPN